MWNGIWLGVGWDTGIPPLGVRVSRPLLPQAGYGWLRGLVGGGAVRLGPCPRKAIRWSGWC